MAFRMDKHLDRLFQSAKSLGMVLAYDRDTFAEAVASTARANQIQRGLIKMMAYWAEEAIVTLVLDTKLDTAIFAIPENDEVILDDPNPVTACFSQWHKLHPLTVPTTAKACANYLNGMLARKSALERGYDIGVLCHTDGFVAEGSIESIFMVKDGQLVTPPLGKILASISRMSIIEAAPLFDLKVSERMITAEELLFADEIFTSNSGTKVLPVKRFEDRDLPAPGPVTSRLTEIMQEITSLKDERFAHWFQPL